MLNINAFSGILIYLMELVIGIQVVAFMNLKITLILAVVIILQILHF